MKIAIFYTQISIIYLNWVWWYLKYALFEFFTGFEIILINACISKCSDYQDLAK